MGDETVPGTGPTRIVPLGELQGELADGECDVEGWHVMAADGTRVGEVERVLVDADARRIRYLDVDLEEYLVPTHQVRRVLIPVAQTQLFDEGQTVLVPRMRGEDIVNLPPYPDTPVSREYDLEFYDRVGNDLGVRPLEEQGFLGLPGRKDREAGK